MGGTVSRKRQRVALLLFGALGWWGAAGADIAGQDARVLLQGAGATLPAPLYQHWIRRYAQSAPNVRVTYQAVGSGEGIRRFIAREIDFGASDAAMSDEQIAAVPGGVKLVPVTAGMIALAYNLPGLAEPLRLRRDVYVDMLLGKIRRWDDPRIVADNPAAKLPKQDIVRVVRQDSSGTTYAFTNHLSAVSTGWRDQGPGVGKLIDWPGNAMTAAGNEGVAAKIQRSIGSIGYVEYGQAKRLGLTMAALENLAGQFVLPSEAGGLAALRNNQGEMPANLRLFLPDPKGVDAYPVVTLSWLLLYPEYQGAERAAAMKGFVSWGLGEGQDSARDLGLLPLPEEITRLSRSAVATIR